MTWALCTASAARRATSAISATSSGPCGRSIGRPTVSVPRVLACEVSGTATPSVGSPNRTGPDLPASSPASPARSSGRTGSGPVERRAQLGQPVLVGVGERGQPEPARLVDQVHRAPAPRAGGRRPAARPRRSARRRATGPAARWCRPGRPARRGGAGPRRAARRDSTAIATRWATSSARSAASGAAAAPARGRTTRLPRSGAVVGSATTVAAFADGPTSGSGPDRATMRGPAPVALVDLDDHGLGVEHLPQPADELRDQLRGVEPAGELGRQVQQPAHPRRGGPPPPRPAPRRARQAVRRGRRPSVADREPRAVGAVLLVAGAPRRREPREQGQPAAVRGGPAVAAARLGQVLLQRPGTAVADRDERPRPRRCAARPRTRCRRAARRSRRARWPAARRCPRRRSAVSGLGQRRHQHAPCEPGGPRVGRQPDSALLGHGHSASLHGRALRAPGGRQAPVAAAGGIGAGHRDCTGPYVCDPVPGVGRRTERATAHRDGDGRRRRPGRGARPSTTPTGRRSGGRAVSAAGLAQALRAVRLGRFDVRLPRGLSREVVEEFNELVGAAGAAQPRPAADRPGRRPRGPDAASGSTRRPTTARGPRACTRSTP